MLGLENLSPVQRNLVLFGLPAVGVAALVAIIRKPATPPPAPTPAAAPPSGYIAGSNTDVLGLGQLSEFESMLTNSIQGLYGAILKGQTPPPTPPAPPPIYPQSAPLPAGTCPAGYVLEVGATGWTCATPAQHQALLDYLAGAGKH